MRRVTALLAVLLLVTAFPALGADLERADAAQQHRNFKPVLRGAAMVEGDFVRLGDLFDNTGDKSDRPVAYSPRPGHQTVFDGERLSKIARSNRLRWRPRGRFERIVITRSSQSIKTKDIQAAVREALAEEGLPKDLWIGLDRRNMVLHLPVDVPATIALRDFAYDRSTRRFTAMVTAPADAPSIVVPVAGKVDELQRVPVLMRHIARNEVIVDADVDWVEMRRTKVRQGSILDAEDLIGQAPRRPLKAGQPVRRGDVRPPIVIAKGSTITMVYRTKTMTLTTRGRALANGSKGATIQVMNVHSKKVVDAVVQSPDRVVVSATGPLALAQ